MEVYYSGRLKPKEPDPISLLINDEKEIFGRFLWIDAIVRRYPNYKHDDVFYLEYDFCMMLLEIMVKDIDYSVKYDKARQQQQQIRR